MPLLAASVTMNGMVRVYLPMSRWLGVVGVLADEVAKIDRADRVA